MEIEPPKHYTPKQYLVCYLDVLGIRENFFDHIDYHNSEIGQEQLKTINDTIALFHCALCSIDCIKDVQKLFETIIMSLTKALPHDQEKKEIDCSLNQWNFNVSIQHFSDSLLFYTPYDDEKSRAEFEKDAYWFFCVYSIFSLVMISSKFPIRGAITAGIAWEMQNNYLFGPAIHEAYELESNVARHSRIVISPHLLSLIYKRMKENKKDHAIASDDSWLKDLIYYDYDGVPMINYLSVEVLLPIIKYWSFDFLYDLINKSFNAIKTQYKQYCAKYETSDFKNISHKSELAQRYYMMLIFFKRNEKSINRFLLSKGLKTVHFDFE